MGARTSFPDQSILLMSKIPRKRDIFFPRAPTTSCDKCQLKGMMIEIKSHRPHEERVENAWMKLEKRAWLLLIINVTKQLLPMRGSFVYRSKRPNVSLASLPCLQNFLHQNDWEPSFTIQKQLKLKMSRTFATSPSVQLKRPTIAIYYLVPKLTELLKGLIPLQV